LDQWLADLALRVGALAAALFMTTTPTDRAMTILMVALVCLLGYVFQLVVTAGEARED
jgi:hypothetical protein